MAVGHFYSLNLRAHSLAHLAAGQGPHEHALTALKRLRPQGRRQGVRKGTRVLLRGCRKTLDDRAGIE